MIIGEGPGKQEDRQGLPFVGAAGKFLDDLLDLAGLSRDEVFITNIIKCRAPNNRDPEPEEIQACSPHLTRQLLAIDPVLIITLGKHSLARFLPGERSVTKARGVLQARDGRYIYPVIHPAAGLRRPEYKALTTEDFQRIPEVLRTITTAPPEENPPPQSDCPQVTQTSLF